MILHSQYVRNPMKKLSSHMSRDLRKLDPTEVCTTREWLDKYMRLELDNPRITNSKLLMDLLAPSNREYESDFGVFRTDESSDIS